MDWLLRLQSPPPSLYRPLTRQTSQPGGGRVDLIFPRPLSEGILTTPQPQLVSTSREASSVRKGDNNKTNPPPSKSQGSPYSDRLHRRPSSQVGGTPSDTRATGPWAQKGNAVACMEFWELTLEGLSCCPHRDVGLREGEQDLEPKFLVITWV